jgi:pimeloyl-ACP methyl ester carboxylesterase
MYYHTFRYMTRQIRMTLLLIAVGLAAPLGASGQSPKERELVVLVHGMGRSPISMTPLAWTLKRAGYRVMNWGYSSTCCSVAEIGEQLTSDLAERTAEFDRVHFVGHSLGTVIIRWVLTHQPDSQRVGRVVMLAPPNQGAHKADLAARRWSWIMKPLPDLQTAPNSTARTLAMPTGIDVGVIAGKFDGKVSVAETHLEGETEHVVIPAHHSFMMMRRDVHRLTINFLANGAFRSE